MQSNIPFWLTIAIAVIILAADYALWCLVRPKQLDSTVKPLDNISLRGPSASEPKPKASL